MIYLAGLLIKVQEFKNVFKRKINLDQVVYLEGQITVFVLMLFMLVVSILFAQYQSALYYVCRADAERAARISVDSMLAGYQRPLRDRYQILAVDGGFGKKEFKKEWIENQLKIVFEENMQGSLIKTLVNEISIPDGAMYTMLIENDWDFFLREINLNREDALLTEGVQYILDTWKQENDKASLSFQQKRYEAENAQDFSQENEEEMIDRSIENVQDPREGLMSIWNKGILEAACPENFNISEKCISIEDVSFPEAIENVGTWIDFKDDSSVQNLLYKWDEILKPDFGIQEVKNDLAVQAYIQEVFRHALTDESELPRETSALAYEIEYFIGGHETDTENMKIVLWKLLAIRTVFNLSYLMTSAKKHEQVMATATGLSTVLLIPQFTEVVAFVLKVVWAFAEALSDCRTLLNGGKIPLMKNNETWYLSWNQMLQLNAGTLDGNLGNEGLDYASYLQILCVFTEREAKYRRMTHIMEKNIRLYPGYENFYMKNCVYGMQTEFQCKFGRFGSYRVKTALSY